MDKMDVGAKKVTNKYTNGNVVVFHKSAFNSRAELAKELLAHLAIVAGDLDGEDSAGRAKIRLMTPREVALRACEIADEAITEMDWRGWLLEIPDPDLD